MNARRDRERVIRSGEMNRIVADRSYIGAYWGPRYESVDACADRLSRHLSSLSEVDPIFRQWFRKAGSRREAQGQRLDVSPGGLRGLLSAGRQQIPRHGGDVLDLGYNIDIWNGSDAAAGLSVRCGSGARIAGMTSNALMLSLPACAGDLEHDERPRHGDAASALIATVEAWRPAWCTWTSRELRKAQKPGPEDVVFGWVTYVAAVDGNNPPRQVPIEGVAVGVLEGGSLYVVEGCHDADDEGRVLALRGALAGFLKNVCA